MRFGFHGRSVARRVATIGVAAVLWAGLSSGAWQDHAHAGGRAPEPGTAVAWGNDDSGRLGRGVGSGVSTTPVTVCGGASCAGPLDGVVAVEAGSGHGVALRDDGTVWTWGSNQYGQLGDGTTDPRTTPARVGSLTDVTAIAAGDNHSLRVCATGTSAGCTTFLGGATAADVGFRFSVTRQADGTARAWGANGGRLGDGTQTNRSTPVRVCASGQTAPCSRLLDGVGAVAAGFFHTLAVVRPAPICGSRSPRTHPSRTTRT